MKLRGFHMPKIVGGYVDVPGAAECRKKGWRRFREECHRCIGTGYLGGTKIEFRGTTFKCRDCRGLGWVWTVTSGEYKSEFGKATP